MAHDTEWARELAEIVCFPLRWIARLRFVVQHALLRREIRRRNAHR